MPLLTRPTGLSVSHKLYGIRKRRSLASNDTSRAAHRARVRWNWTGNDRRRAYGGTRTHIGHYDSSRAQPAIRTDADVLEVACFIERAGRIPYVLMLTTENLHGRGDLGTFSDSRLSHNAIAADINSGAHSRLRMSKKSTEGNPAGHVALSQSQAIIGNAKVVANATRNGGARLREKCVDWLHPAKARQRGDRRRSYQKYAV